MPKKVLVVEDNPDMMFVLLRALDKEGLAFVSVEEGTAAYAAAIAEKPDVVVIDIVLPGENGIEIGRAIRADDRLKDVKLMGISGHTPSGDICGGLFDDFLEKPFDVSEMVRRLRLLAGIEGSRTDARTKNKSDVVLPDEPVGSGVALTVHGRDGQKRAKKIAKG